MKSACLFLILSATILEIQCGPSTDVVQLQKGIAQVKAWRVEYRNSIEPGQSPSGSSPARRSGQVERTISFADFVSEELTSSFNVPISKEESAGTGMISIKSTELPDGTVRYLDVSISGVNDERLTRIRIWLDSQTSGQIEIYAREQQLSFNRGLAKLVAIRTAEILLGKQQ